jgi:hypothetical protein
MKLQSLAMSCKESTHCLRQSSTSFPKLTESSAKMYSSLVGPVFFLHLCDSHTLIPGKSSVVTTAEGLRVASIGGTYKAAVYNGSEIPHVRVHSKGDPKRRNHCRASHPLISHRKLSRNYSPTLFRLVLLAPLLSHP